jgi:hypothetical protein
VKSAGEKDLLRDAIRDRGNETTHAVHSIGKRLGILQKFIRGSLKEGKILLIIVELCIRGLWKGGDV